MQKENTTRIIIRCGILGKNLRKFRVPASGLKLHQNIKSAGDNIRLRGRKADRASCALGIGAQVRTAIRRDLNPVRRNLSALILETQNFWKRTTFPNPKTGITNFESAILAGSATLGLETDVLARGQAAAERVKGHIPCRKSCEHTPTWYTYIGYILSYGIMCIALRFRM